MLDVVLNCFCLVFAFCLVSLQEDDYNGGLLPDIHYTVEPMLRPSGNSFEYHEEVFYLQPMIPPNKRFDFFPLTGGCSEGLGAFMGWALSNEAEFLCVCVVFFPFILDIKFVGRTSRGHTGGRSHRISHPPSFCGACLNFSREKDSAIPFPRRP